jgi:hypothetical protein
MCILITGVDDAGRLFGVTAVQELISMLYQWIFADTRP